MIIPQKKPAHETAISEAGESKSTLVCVAALPINQNPPEKQRKITIAEHQAWRESLADGGKDGML